MYSIQKCNILIKDKTKGIRNSFLLSVFTIFPNLCGAFCIAVQLEKFASCLALPILLLI